jgi:hypothetical protein
MGRALLEGDQRLGGRSLARRQGGEVEGALAIA